MRAYPAKSYLVSDYGLGSDQQRCIDLTRFE